MSSSNILSIDGGGVTVVLPLRLIQRIQEQRPGFLESVEVFAGTSAGGISAIIMAASDTPAEGLEKCLYLWEQTPVFPVSPGNLFGGLLGRAPLYPNSVLKDALTRILGTVTLGALKRKVLVASFQLDNKDHDPAKRSWGPRIFSNFDSEHREDLRESAVDIALRTSAAPLMFPVYQGYVDGGLYANDPSMFALVAAMRRLQEESASGGLERDSLGQISLFSCGCGQPLHYLDSGTGNWGYREWVFNPKVPLAILDLALQAEGEAIGRQCRSILGERQYYRLNPEHRTPVGRVTQSPHPVTSAKVVAKDPTKAPQHTTNPAQVGAEAARQEAEDVDLAATLAWLDSSEWFKSPATGPSPGAARPGRTRGAGTTAARRSTRARPAPATDQAGGT